MPAEAAIYLPYDNVDLRRVFPEAVPHLDTNGRTTCFDVMLGDEEVRFNVMPHEELPAHLDGFKAYLDSLEEPHRCKSDARMLVAHTKTILGLVAGNEFAENPAIWQSLFRIADQWNGFVFTFDSVVLPGGGVVLGPLKDGAPSP